MNLTGHPEVGVKQECDGISEEVLPCRLATIIAAWAVGGNVSNYLLNYACLHIHAYLHAYIIK